MRLKHLVILFFMLSLAVAGDLRISATLSEEAVSSGEKILLEGTVIYKNRVAKDVDVRIETGWGEIHEIDTDNNGHFEVYLTPESSEDEEFDIKISVEFYGEEAEKTLDILVEGDDDGETSTRAGMYRITIKSPIIYGHRVVLRGEIEKNGKPWKGYVKIITPKLITFAKTDSDGVFEKTIYHDGEILFIAGTTEKKITVTRKEVIFNIDSFGNRIYGKILDYDEIPVSGTLYIDGDAHFIPFGNVNIEASCGEHELLFMDRTHRISGEEQITLCEVSERDEDLEDEYVINAEFLSHETENTTIRIMIRDLDGNLLKKHVRVEVSGKIYEDIIDGTGSIMTKPRPDLQTIRITVGGTERVLSRVIEKSFSLSVDAPLRAGSKFDVIVENNGLRAQKDVFVRAEDFEVGIGDLDVGKRKTVLIVLEDKPEDRIVDVIARSRSSSSDRVVIGGIGVPESPDDGPEDIPDKIPEKILEEIPVMKAELPIFLKGEGVIRSTVLLILGMAFLVLVI